jgi:hypothetical protein
MVNLELRMSPRIFKKIRNGHKGILWAWGKLIDEKKPEAKNRVTCPIKYVCCTYSHKRTVQFCAMCIAVLYITVALRLLCLFFVLTVLIPLTSKHFKEGDIANETISC